MKQTLTNRRKVVIGAALLMLTFALVLKPTGRPGGVSAFVQIGHIVAQLPRTIVNGIKSLSLNRLDPTCPQCI